MTRTPPGLPRISTGVPGLDDILEGGLPIGGVFLVQGAPGSGKTILANQLCFHHAKRGEQVVYITLLAETHARMFGHLRRLSYFDEDCIGNAIHYHAAFRVLEEQGLEGLVRLTREAALERQATLIVIDGLVAAEELAKSNTHLKQLLHVIQTMSTSLGCTVLLLSSGAEREAPPDHTIVDGIIEVSCQLHGLRARRHIEVTKMRGVDAVMGQHSLEISDAGIKVHPRLESRLLLGESGRLYAQPHVRVPFGIPSLDQMLEGGLPSGSTTMLVGPTGAGKTMLGLQFVCDGPENDEQSLYFGFYERPPAIIEKCKRIGLPVEAGLKSGLLEIEWERPVEGVLDAIADRLLTKIQKQGIKRLCFDGAQALRRTIDNPERIHSATATLTEELERFGVTAVTTMETHDLLGPVLSVPIQDISASTHNIILLRHVEMRAELFRLISILKMRDSGYDSRIREFRITGQGIHVEDTFQSAQAVLSGIAVTAPTTTKTRAKAKSKPRKARKRT